MALIKCPECEKEISSKAKTCPHCGCPLEKKEDNKSKVPKKRFHSKEYKMTGIILSIPCSLILLIFLLGITFNNIIPSVILAGIYGLIIYFMSKFMLNTKPHIKKYLWIVIVVVLLPLIISFYLLTKNQEISYENDVIKLEYNLKKNALGTCTFYYKDTHNNVEVKAKQCRWKEDKNVAKGLYILDIVDTNNQKYTTTCVLNPGPHPKGGCSGPRKNI